MPHGTSQRPPVVPQGSVDIRERPVAPALTQSIVEAPGGVEVSQVVDDGGGEVSQEGAAVSEAETGVRLKQLVTQLTGDVQCVSGEQNG